MANSRICFLHSEREVSSWIPVLIHNNNDLSFCQSAVIEFHVKEYISAPDIFDWLRHVYADYSMNANSVWR